MDILLDKNGDLFVSKQGDIAIENSVVQKIKIRLRWFLGEWRWDQEEGLPYFDNILVKNPDIDFIESQIRLKIFEVDEVTEVSNVELTLDKKTRTAHIKFEAKTDTETIKEEVSTQCQITE